MDTAFSAFLSWNFILYCLGVSTITYVVRTITEYFAQKFKFMATFIASPFWTELFLPLMPLINGGVIAYFATGYPYPYGISALSGRIVFGVVGGMLSGLIFRVLKGLLKASIQSIVSPVTGVVDSISPTADDLPPRGQI